MGNRDTIILRDFQEFILLHWRHITTVRHATGEQWAYFRHQVLPGTWMAVFARERRVILGLGRRTDCVRASAQHTLVLENLPELLPDDQWEVTLAPRDEPQTQSPEVQQ